MTAVTATEASAYDITTKIGPEISLNDLPTEVAADLRIALKTARELGFDFMLGWIEDEDKLWIGAVPGK